MDPTFAEGESWKNRKTGHRLKIEKPVGNAKALVWYIDDDTAEGAARMMRKSTLVRDYDLVAAAPGPVVALRTGDLIVVGGKIRQVLNDFPSTDFVTLAYLGGGALAGGRLRELDGHGSAPVTVEHIKVAALRELGAVRLKTEAILSILA